MRTTLPQSRQRTVAPYLQPTETPCRSTWSSQARQARQARQASPASPAAALPASPSASPH